MIMFLSAVDMNESGDGSDSEGVIQAKLSRYTIDFITSMRATVVSLGMYPPGSMTIANAVEKVSHNLQNVLSVKPEMTFSEVNGLLLVDGQQLDERDRKKAPVVDFIAALIERHVQSITFHKDSTAEELVDFLVILSRKPKELKDLGPIQEQMADKGIENIQTNERIYVATTAEEAEHMDKLQDMLKKQLFSDDMLLEEGETGLTFAELSRGQFSAILENKDQVSQMLGDMVSEELQVDESRMGDRDYVKLQAEKVGDIMRRAYGILEHMEEGPQRQAFEQSLASMVSDLNPKILGQMLVEEQMNPTSLTNEGIIGKMFDNMDSTTAVGVTEHMIDDLEVLKQSLAHLPPDERQVRVKAFKDLVKLIINNTIQRDFFVEIAEMLQEAKLIKENLANQLQNQVVATQESTEIATVSIQNQDGSLKEETLSKIIRLFDRIPNEQLPGIVAGMNNVIGEIIFHDDVALLTEKLIERLDRETDFSAVYESCAEALEGLCRELIFNENYQLALLIVQSFKEHADPDIERHYEQKRCSTTAMETLASDDVNRMLLTVFQHGEEESRMNVGDLIVKMGDRMLSAMIDMLKNTDDRSLRRNLLDLLKQMGTGLLETIRAEISKESNEWFVVRNMILLLAEVGNTEHTDWLNPLVANADARVRKEALKALVKLDPEVAVTSVREMIVDPDMGVKRFIIGLIGTLKDSESIQTLSGFLEKRTIAQVEEEESLQLEAVTALGRIGDPSAIPVLLETLKKEGLFSKIRTKTPSIRARAVYALAAFPSPEVVKAVKAATKDKEDDVKEAAKAILPRLQ